MSTTAAFSTKNEDIFDDEEGLHQQEGLHRYFQVADTQDVDEEGVHWNLIDDYVDFNTGSEEGVHRYLRSRGKEGDHWNQIDDGAKHDDNTECEHAAAALRGESIAHTNTHDPNHNHFPVYMQHEVEVSSFLHVCMPHCSKGSSHNVSMHHEVEASSLLHRSQPEHKCLSQGEVGVSSLLHPSSK